MSVYLADEQNVPTPAETLRGLATYVLAEEQAPAGAEVGLLLVDVDQMSAYNERFMQRGGPTDVLALPIEDYRAGPSAEHDPAGPPLALGDVLVCPEVVRRRSDAAGVAFEEELALMVVHGILHLLGYEHNNDEEAELMESRERELLAKNPGAVG